MQKLEKEATERVEEVDELRQQLSDFHFVSNVDLVGISKNQKSYDDHSKLEGEKMSKEKIGVDGQLDSSPILFSDDDEELIDGDSKTVKKHTASLVNFLISVFISLIFIFKYFK